MRTGTLRHLVTIEQYAETVNTVGEPIKAWTEYGSAWANIAPLAGGEKYVSAEKHATATHQITIRYLEGVSPKMRVLYGTRTLEVLSVINTGERNKMMQIIAKEEVDHD